MNDPVIASTLACVKVFERPTYGFIISFSKLSVENVSPSYRSILSILNVIKTFYSFPRWPLETTLNKIYTI